VLFAKWGDFVGPVANTVGSPWLLRFLLGHRPALAHSVAAFGDKAGG